MARISSSFSPFNKSSEIPYTSTAHRQAASVAAVLFLARAISPVWVPYAAAPMSADAAMGIRKVRIHSCRYLIYLAMDLEFRSEEHTSELQSH